MRAWEAALLDLVKAYRMSFGFIETWLGYVATAVSAASNLREEGYSLEALPFFPAGSARDLNGLEKDLSIDLTGKILKEGAASSNEAFFALDNLIARADHKWWHFWEPLADWRVALLLEKMGRFAEASFFMDRFERTELLVFGLPEEDKRGFYRDYARVLLAHDLCRETDWDKALASLKKASAIHGAVGDEAGGHEGQSEDVPAFMRAREKDAKRKEKAAGTKGAFFFDYAPQYVVDELSRLVEDVSRLAAAALYNKECFLDSFAKLPSK